MRRETFTGLPYQKYVLNFNPLPPCGGRRLAGSGTGWRYHFNPLPPCGGRRSVGAGQVRPDEFQSTPPMRRETVHPREPRAAVKISIHSPHAEGDGVSASYGSFNKISIHSPHAEGDGVTTSQQMLQSISIHSPHAEGDSTRHLTPIVFPIFQSTPPMRRETGGACHCRGRNGISIHSPHAEGDYYVANVLANGEISIHSPHAEGDDCNGRERRRKT